MVKNKSGLEDVQTAHTTVVKQGDSLAFIIFLLYFQMCIEVLDSRWTAAKPSFLYKMDDIINGRRANEKWGTSLEVYKSCMQTTGLS